MRRLALVLLVTFLGLPGCAISEKDEIEMGRKVHAKLEQQSGGLYADPGVQRYVNSVGMRLASQADRPNLDWQYRVVNSNQINAFAVPGGYIYITKGLLFRMQNEAQLAGVLGHETAHIANRDSVRQIQRTQGANVLSGVVGVVGSLFGVGFLGDVTSVASQLTLLKYDRGQEKEADMDGLRYMTADGYNPNGMVQTMQILKAASGGKSAGFLSSHPDPGNRVQYLSAAVKQEYAPRTATGRYGEAEFAANVLSRAPRALAPIDWSEAATWCGHCGRSPGAVARSGGSRELLYDR